MVIDSNVENNNEDNTKQAGTSTFSEPLNDLTIDVTSSEGVKIEVEDVKSGEVGTTTDSMKAEAEGDVEGDIVKTSATAAVPETAVQAPTDLSDSTTPNTSTPAPPTFPPRPPFVPTSHTIPPYNPPNIAIPTQTRLFLSQLRYFSSMFAARINNDKIPNLDCPLQPTPSILGYESSTVQEVESYTSSGLGRQFLQLRHALLTSLYSTGCYEGREEVAFLNSDKFSLHLKTMGRKGAGMSKSFRVGKKEQEEGEMEVSQLIEVCRGAFKSPKEGIRGVVEVCEAHKKDLRAVWGTLVGVGGIVAVEKGGKRGRSGSRENYEKIGEGGEDEGGKERGVEKGEEKKTKEHPWFGFEIPPPYMHAEALAQLRLYTSMLRLIPIHTPGVLASLAEKIVQHCLTTFPGREDYAFPISVAAMKVGDGLREAEGEIEIGRKKVGGRRGVKKGGNNKLNTSAAVPAKEATVGNVPPASPANLAPANAAPATANNKGATTQAANTTENKAAEPPAQSAASVAGEKLKQHSTKDAAITDWAPGAQQEEVEKNTTTEAMDTEKETHTENTTTDTNTETRVNTAEPAPPPVPASIPVLALASAPVVATIAVAAQPKDHTTVPKAGRHPKLQASKASPQSPTPAQLSVEVAESKADTLIKRGPGRPPKNSPKASPPAQPSVTSPAQIKRGPGRPPKNSPKASPPPQSPVASPIPIKRGPGRPPKNSPKSPSLLQLPIADTQPMGTFPAQKRKVGRPPKNSPKASPPAQPSGAVVQTMDTTPVPVRKVGRPPKNFPKSSPSVQPSVTVEQLKDAVDKMLTEEFVASESSWSLLMEYPEKLKELDKVSVELVKAKVGEHLLLKELTKRSGREKRTFAGNWSRAIIKAVGRIGVEGLQEECDRINQLDVEDIDVIVEERPDEGGLLGRICPAIGEETSDMDEEEEEEEEEKEEEQEEQGGEQGRQRMKLHLTSPYSVKRDKRGNWEDPSRPPMDFIPGMAAGELLAKAKHNLDLAKGLMLHPAVSQQNVSQFGGGASVLGSPYGGNKKRKNSTLFNQLGMDSDKWGTNGKSGIGVPNDFHTVAPLPDARIPYYGRGRAKKRGRIVDGGGARVAGLEEVDGMEGVENAEFFTSSLEWNDIANQFTGVDALDVGEVELAGEKNIIKGGSQLLAPTFRSIVGTEDDPDKEGGEFIGVGEDGYEDLSDEVVLRRHNEVLGRMKAKIETIKEARALKLQNDKHGRQKI